MGLNHLLMPAGTDVAVIASLERRVSLQGARISTLERDLEAMRTEVAAARAALRADPDVVLSEEDHGAIATTEAPTEAIRVARARFNRDLRHANSAFMIQTLGPPRSSYSDQCDPLENPRLRGALVTERFVDFRVTLVRPAMESFRAVMAQIEAADPDLYSQLGTAGGLCPRLIRGSDTAVSNHSFGTAVDLKIAGVLDPFADGETHAGLVLIATIFNDAGWFWGGGYGREDSMHFEASRDLIERWVSEGAL
ncbi:MAG: M15 family metallopeptidase [Paracoccaceae bacterium]|nr:M15 family metallopeptidase [Paracoccaceae bacterium]